MSAEVFDFTAPKTFWTPERIEVLRALWAAGHSASHIARLLGSGCSRNAVIGKVHRIGLSSRKTPSRPVKAKYSTRPMPTSPCVPGSVPMLDLLPGDCRYPMGDPSAKEFGFCGCPKWGESSYCHEHHKLAHQYKADRRLAQLERRAA